MSPASLTWSSRRRVAPSPCDRKGAAGAPTPRARRSRLVVIRPEGSTVVHRAVGRQVARSWNAVARGHGGRRVDAARLTVQGPLPGAAASEMRHVLPIAPRRSVALPRRSVDRRRSQAAAPCGSRPDHERRPRRVAPLGERQLRPRSGVCAEPSSRTVSWAGAVSLTSTSRRGVLECTTPGSPNVTAGAVASTLTSAVTLRWFPAASVAVTRAGSRRPRRSARARRLRRHRRSPGPSRRRRRR